MSNANNTQNSGSGFLSFFQDPQFHNGNVNVPNSTTSDEEFIRAFTDNGLGQGYGNQTSDNMLNLNIEHNQSFMMPAPSLQHHPQTHNYRYGTPNDDCVTGVPIDDAFTRGMGLGQQAQGQQQQQPKDNNTSRIGGQEQNQTLISMFKCKQEIPKLELTGSTAFERSLKELLPLLSSVTGAQKWIIFKQAIKCPTGKTLIQTVETEYEVVNPKSEETYEKMSKSLAKKLFTQLGFSTTSVADDREHDWNQCKVDISESNKARRLRDFRIRYELARARCITEGLVEENLETLCHPDNKSSTRIARKEYSLIKRNVLTHAKELSDALAPKGTTLTLRMVLDAIVSIAVGYEELEKALAEVDKTTKAPAQAAAVVQLPQQVTPALTQTIPTETNVVGELLNFMGYWKGQGQAGSSKGQNYYNYGNRQGSYKGNNNYKGGNSSGSYRNSKGYNNNGNTRSYSGSFNGQSNYYRSGNSSKGQGKNRGNDFSGKGNGSVWDQAFKKGMAKGRSQGDGNRHSGTGHGGGKSHGQ